MGQRIFVSYSHHDAHLVTPVVRLLRATDDFVFLDADSISPGSKWRSRISEALVEANLVVVFWCLHSSESEEVGKEYRAALEAAKDLLPVLLDSTPIPADLSEYQWIDFRELGRAQHIAIEPGWLDPPRKKQVLSKHRTLLIVSLFAALLLVPIFYLPAPHSATYPGVDTLPSRDSIDSIGPGQTYSAAKSSFGVLWLLLFLIGSVAILLAVRSYLSRLSTASGPSSARPPTQQEWQMAESLQKEIRRRLRRD